MHAVIACQVCVVLIKCNPFLNEMEAGCMQGIFAY